MKFALTPAKFFFLLVGILMVSGPYFPNSDVSEQANKDGFLAVTAIGSIVIVMAILSMFFMK